MRPGHLICLIIAIICGIFGWLTGPAGIASFLLVFFIAFVALEIGWFFYEALLGARELGQFLGKKIAEEKLKERRNK